MTSPSILLPDTFTEYWRFSVYLRVDCLGNMMLNYCYQWSSVSHSYTDIPKKKLIRATKKITLYLHICVLVQLHTGECLAPDLRDFTVTTGIPFSADGTSHLNQTGPAQCYRTEPLQCVCVWGGEKHWKPFFLQGKLQALPAWALSGEGTSSCPDSSCQVSEHLGRNQLIFKHLLQIASGNIASRPNNWIVH